MGGRLKAGEQEGIYSLDYSLYGPNMAFVAFTLIYRSFNLDVDKSSRSAYF